MYLKADKHHSQVISLKAGCREIKALLLLDGGDMVLFAPNKLDIP